MEDDFDCEDSDRSALRRFHCSRAEKDLASYEGVMLNLSIDIVKEFIEVVSVMSALMSILAVAFKLSKKLLVRHPTQYTDGDIVMQHREAYKTAIQGRPNSKINLSSSQVRRNKRISTRSNISDAKCDRRAVILFLGADVYPDKAIGVGKDALVLKRCLSGSEVFKVVAKQGVKKKDIVPLIAKYKPAIVHFDGHGGTLGFAVHANNGSDQLEIVTPDDLKRIFNAATGHLKLAYFDACDSDSHAKMAVLAIATAIGMKSKISPIAARIFSRQFYVSLENLYSIHESFELACGQLNMENMEKFSDVPVLRARVGCDPKSIKFVINDRRKESRDDV